MALIEAVQEAKFLKQLFVDVKVVQVSYRVVINVDNQGTINLARNPMYHKRSKHIQARYHFIRDEIRSGKTDLQYIPTAKIMSQISSPNLSPG